MRDVINSAATFFSYAVGVALVAGVGHVVFSISSALAAS